MTTDGRRVAAPPARVLVVDDTESNRDLLSRRLEREGHRVQTAPDGRVAIEMLQSEPFDLEPVGGHHLGHHRALTGRTTRSTTPR